MSDDRLIYRPAQAARALGIARSTLYVLVAAGELELLRLGPRASGIPADSLRAFIERQRQACGHARPERRAALATA